MLLDALLHKKSLTWFELKGREHEVTFRVPVNYEIDSSTAEITVTIKQNKSFIQVSLYGKIL